MTDYVKVDTEDEESTLFKVDDEGANDNDNDENDDNDEDGDEDGSSPGSSSVNVLISKPPSQPRDVGYSFLYFVVFVVMVGLTIFRRDEPSPHAIVSTKYAGNWASHIMISPVMGTFGGVSLSFLLFMEPMRHCLLSMSIGLAFVVNMGMIVALFFSRYWIVGLILILKVYVFDRKKSSYAKSNMDSSIALIDMVMSLNKTFDLMLVIVSFALILAQMCVLLWWSALFVSAVSKESIGGSVPLALLFLAVFYLICNLFRALLASVVGGSFLWLFLRDQAPPYHFRHIMRQVMLYVNTSLTSSIGSICKAAVFVPPCQAVLSSIAHLEFSMRSYSSHQSRCSGLLTHAATFILRRYFYAQAKKFPRLSLFYVPVFGFSLNKAVKVVDQKSSEGLQVLSLESTGSLFDNLSFSVASIVSLILLAVAEHEDEQASLGPYWPLFFALCFMLSYASASLSFEAFCSAADALILSFAESPNLFEEKNAILYHRWLRINEIEVA